MSSGAQANPWQGPSRRRSTRFRVHAPLDVTVLRSGVPDTVPGRSVDVCERGISAMLAGEIKPGEVVGVEVQLPTGSDSLRSRALVRYQDKLRCGMEFVGLSPEQRAAIREWVDRSKAESDPSLSLHAVNVLEPATAGGGKGAVFSGGGGPPSPPKKKRRKLIWFFLLLIAAFALGFFWWRWNHEWEQLEAGLPNRGTFNSSTSGSSNSGTNSDAGLAEKVQAQVPTEVMQRLLLHKVDPVYPAAARKDKLQGVIVLDLVVGKDGSVLDARPQNGPDVLAHAAVEAARWWRFEPYKLNGEPAIVGTRVAVEFKP